MGAGSHSRQGGKVKHEEGIVGESRGAQTVVHFTELSSTLSLDLIVFHLVLHTVSPILFHTHSCLSDFPLPPYS